MEGIVAMASAATRVGSRRPQLAVERLRACAVVYALASGFAQAGVSREIYMTAREQYVVDEAGKRTAVLVPLDEWERIQAALEELADVRAYDEAKRDPSDPVPFEQAMAEIEANAGN
jgi:hypothetical protein